MALTGNIEDGGRTNEVDLTQFVKGEFERLRPVALIFVRPTGHCEILDLWIEKRQDLRIIKEDIDVVAFTMIDLEHERRPAAEAPRGHEADVLLELGEDFHRKIEQDRPLAWAALDHALRRQRERVAREVGELVGDRADLVGVDTHFLDELQLQSRAYFREEGKHGRVEIARALWVGDQRSELMRGKVRPIRSVHRRQHQAYRLCHF